MGWKVQDGSWFAMIEGSARSLFSYVPAFHTRTGRCLTYARLQSSVLDRSSIWHIQPTLWDALHEDKGRSSAQSSRFVPTRRMTHETVLHAVVLLQSTTDAGRRSWLGRRALELQLGLQRCHMLKEKSARDKTQDTRKRDRICEHVYIYIYISS